MCKDTLIVLVQYFSTKASLYKQTWIHGNEETDSWCEINLLSKEEEPLLLVSDGILNTLDLYSHDRQHLN